MIEDFEELRKQGYAQAVWVVASEMTRPDPQYLEGGKGLFKELGLDGSAKNLAEEYGEFGVSSEEAKQDIVLALREYAMHLPMPGAPQGFRATREKIEGCPVCYPDKPAGVPRGLAWTDGGLFE